MKNVFDVFYQLIFACYEIEYRQFQNHFSSERKRHRQKRNMLVKQVLEDFYSQLSKTERYKDSLKSRLTWLPMINKSEWYLMP